VLNLAQIRESAMVLLYTYLFVKH